MRDQGRLVEWFDDKGYGFIQPHDTHKDRVFIRIAVKPRGLARGYKAAIR